jgi:hypothetical protein
MCYPTKKLRLYGLIGPREYFAFDPHAKRVWPKSIKTRLLGWQYNKDGQAVPILPDERGWLWSNVLESWFVPDDLQLRLHDRSGQMRLTATEAAARDVAALKTQLQQTNQRLSQQEQRLADMQRLMEEMRRRLDEQA